MGVQQATRNGRPENKAVSPIPMPISMPTSEPEVATPPSAEDPGPNETAATAALEDTLNSMKHRYPYQLHIRGWQRSGKTTLMAATDDVVCSRVPAGTQRSRALLEQSLGIIRGDGPTATPHLAAGPDTLDKVERLIYPSPQGQDRLVVSFPHDPLGGLDARKAIQTYQDPRIVLAPVIWATRVDLTVARNVWFALAADIQERGPEGMDPRVAIRHGFKIAFNEFSDDAMLAYGTDGLEEMFRDERLAGTRIRVSNRRGPHARMMFDGQGKSSIRYEEILVELAGKVVRSANLKSHNSYAEVLQAIKDPLLYVAGWDLVHSFDALFRQPALPEIIFKKFFGDHAPRTNRNFFLQGGINARIKPGAGKVYVLGTATEGASSILSVFEERIASAPAPAPRKSWKILRNFGRGKS